jgi:hypothetical protein
MTLDEHGIASSRDSGGRRTLEPTHRTNAENVGSTVDGVATALELSGGQFGQMHALWRLAFTNAGLEAESQDGIPCGVDLSIGFQSPTQRARRGTVTACERHDGSFHIAVAIDPRTFPDC